MARRTATISSGEKFILNQTVEGTYRGMREGQYGPDAPLVDIEIDGEVKTYYGKVALARKLANVPEGVEVFITFLGLKAHPTQKGKTFNDFDVEWDDGEPETAPATKPAPKTAPKPAPAAPKATATTKPKPTPKPKPAPTAPPAEAKDDDEVPF
jgi:hypothetical protein